jgi:hypothetical protein
MISTSLEQSRKLIALGLDTETSDMVWQSIEDDESFGGTWEVIPKCNSLNVGYKDDVSAWSFQALIELMPKLEKRGYEKSYPKVVRHNFTNKYFGHCLHYDTDMFDSPIDAAYDLVVWLIENNYIMTSTK